MAEKTTRKKATEKTAVNTRVQLQTCHGQWLSAQPDGTFEVRETPGPWETFTLAMLDVQQPPVPPDPQPPDVVVPPGQDAFDLHAAIVASGDCPSVAGLPILSAVATITLTDTGSSEGQGYAMNWPGRETWPGVVPPGWDGPINHTLWMCLRVAGQWYMLPVKEGLGDYLTLGPILYPGQVPNNLTYFASGPMQGYQPMPGEQVGFFCTTGDTRRMNLQPLGPGRTNVVLVPFTAGTYDF